MGCSHSQNIIECCRAGDISGLKQCIENKLPLDLLNKKDFSDGLTGLMYAVNNNHIEMVSMLINAGANLNIKSYAKGYSALMLACKKGYSEMVLLLVNAGVYLNYHDHDGQITAISIAITCKHYDCVQILVDAGATIVYANMIQACKYTDIRYARVLIGHVERDYSLLMHICKTNKGSLLELFVKDGYQPSSDDQIAAINSGSIDCLVVLIRYGLPYDKDCNNHAYSTAINRIIKQDKKKRDDITTYISGDIYDNIVMKYLTVTKKI